MAFMSALFSFFVNLIQKFLHVMKTRIFFLSLILVSFSAVTYSQTIEKSLAARESIDSVGLHQNILSDNAMNNMASIFRTSYGYSNTKPLIFGSEISASYYYKDFPFVAINGISLSLYSGNSSSYNKSINGFDELSYMSNITLDQTMKYKSIDRLYYLAPGISMFSKHKRFSLDFFHKLSTPIFIEDSYQIMPYKVNFHF